MQGYVLPIRLRVDFPHEVLQPGDNDEDEDKDSVTTEEGSDSSESIGTTLDEEDARRADTPVEDGALPGNANDPPSSNATGREKVQGASHAQAALLKRLDCISSMTLSSWSCFCAFMILWMRYHDRVGIELSKFAMYNVALIFALDVYCIWLRRCQRLHHWFVEVYEWRTCSYLLIGVQSLVLVLLLYHFG